MCNCGNKRTELKQQSYKLTSNVIAERNTSGYWKDVTFEYIGLSSLTVTGGVTGKRYRFNQQGAKVLIDYRDASGITSIPLLKKITLH